MRSDVMDFKFRKEKTFSMSSGVITGYKYRHT
jgi:hypothetical protein